ncbi:MAG: AIPR family protein [Metamycoplasmataceae bacterium]
MKQINFKNEKLKEIYNKYVEKNISFISNCETEYSRKIGFLTDFILNDKDDVTDSDISTKIRDENENDYFDVIWADKKEDKENIAFLNWLDIDSDDINDINNIIELSIEKIMNYWFDFRNEKGPIKNNENDEVISNMEEVFEEFYSGDINNYSEIRECLIYFVINDRKERNKEQKEAYKKNFTLKIRKIKDNDKAKSKNLKVKFIFEDDVIELYNKRQGSKICISSDVLKIDNGNNILKYDSKNEFIEKAIICNLSAKSINELYKKYENNLLGLNLRFYVKNKKIDDKMKESITEGSSLFWFKNNGLVIICENFEIGSNEINIKNFSIVNGGQTTFNIGNFDHSVFEKNDFHIVTKIIAVKGMNENPDIETYELANEIASATNQQKAIKDIDLISNLPIIKRVKDLFQSKADIKIFVLIRRGDKCSDSEKEIFKQKYQSIKAEQILQIHNSFINLIPGTCRNEKAKLYNDKEKVESCFQYIENNINIYNELIIMFKIHEKFKTPKELKKFGKDSKNFVKYAQYISLASIQLIFILSSSEKLYKEFYSLFNDYKHGEIQIDDIIDWIKNEFAKLKVKKIFRYDLSSNNFAKLINDSYKRVINEFLALRFSEAYNEANEIAKTSGGDIVVSNFGKNDSEFYKFIIPKIIYLLKYKENKDIVRELFNIPEEK